METAQAKKKSDGHRDDSKHPRPADEIDGLPPSLSSEALAVCLDGGARLALTEADRVTVFRLEFGDGRTYAVEELSHDLPGRAVAVAESGLGLVVATERDGRAGFLLVQGKRIVELLEVAGCVTTLAGVAGQTFAVVASPDDERARVVQIDLRQREIVAQRAVAHSGVRLSTHASGQRLVVADPVARTVVTLGAGLEPLTGASSRPEVQPRVSHPAEERQSHERDRLEAEARRAGCWLCCPPTGTDGDESEHRHETGEQSPGEPCPPVHEGQAGVPADDGGTVVGDGDRVTHHPPGGSVRSPCGRRLFWDIASLQRWGPYVLASDHSGRNAALVSADMNLVSEWRFGRGGALLLTTPEAPRLLIHERETRRWVWRDLAQTVDSLEGALDRFPPAALETKTFIGQQSYPLSYGQPTSPTSIKAVVLPIIEGSQTYSSADLAGYASFLNRTMVPLVRDYYTENSFNTLTDLQFSIFGVDVGPTDGPLTLPRAKLADYYHPTYVGASLDLVKTGVTAANKVILDGRESLVVQAKPLNGGPPGGTLTFPFFALGFVRDDDLFPVSIKFLGTEQLTLDVKSPSGAAHILTLSFLQRTVEINDLADVPARLGQLAAYLDGVMAAAEAAAGITPRLFAAPKVVRVPQAGQQFGRLLVTFATADTSGARLSCESTGAVTPGGDPLSLTAPLVGTIAVIDTVALGRYLENAALLAQEAAGFGYNARLLEPPTATFDPAAGTLTTHIPISNRDGGPGAEVKQVSSSGLEALYDSSTPNPNSASTLNNAQALRDREDLYRDVLTAAMDRLRAANIKTDALKDKTCALIIPVEPAAPNPADPTAPLPSEAWNVSPLDRPFDFRGAENMITVIDRKDSKVQLQAAWSLIFMKKGKPDNAMIIHELGHALGYWDLYAQTGYRDDLGYMDGWAMMDQHRDLSHHCGYHKLESQWIPDGKGTEQDYGRVFPLGLPDPAAIRSWDLLLVPIELWRDSLVGSARAAFGVGSDVPVVQLAYVDLGGDGSTFGLIEARQEGAKFSKNLPINTGGVLITNGLRWGLDERFALDNRYRRQLQLLNPNDILQHAGDRFDLAQSAELAVKGMVVEVADRKVVEGDAQVYRIKVTRQNAEFVDLYFTEGDPYYKSPDLWVDWVDNNGADPTQLNPAYPPGPPTDQGEAIRVHPSNPEQHWLVGRLRNRGQVKALDVKVNFFMCDPPGAGDRGKNFKLIGSVTEPEIPGGDNPKNVLLRWDVPSGSSGHSCLVVEVEDYRIPEDSTGAALGSDDVWRVNNHCQKNVDKYEALSASPFASIDFDFSVHNDGVDVETAYLEPDGLPDGMRLTVTPPRRSISAGATVMFHCKLELDEEVIRTGCENDQRFRIVAWRQEGESAVRWGGVEYEVRPREKTETTIMGGWGYGNDVEVNGSRDPGSRRGNSAAATGLPEPAARVAVTPGGTRWRVRMDRLFTAAQLHPRGGRLVRRKPFVRIVAVERPPSHPAPTRQVTPAEGLRPSVASLKGRAATASAPVIWSKRDFRRSLPQVR